MILNFTDPFFTTRVLGFEPLFDRLQRLSESSDRSSSYPPYNIRKDGNHFAIEIAVAGLTKKDINYAQKHLRILSGLYGILKPLDVIEPYRLEMGTKLKTKNGSNLYDFWGKNISKEIEKELKDMNSNLLINLASNEYYDSVQSLSDDIKVISPIFKDKGKDGKYKIISFYAKKARGYMASWLVKNQIKKEQELQSFSEEGYSFSIEESHSGSPVFLRD